MAGTPITPATLVVFLGIVVLTFLISHFVQRALVRAMRLLRIREEGTIEATRRLSHYVMVAVGLGVAGGVMLGYFYRKGWISWRS